jgi:uncharacterized membrane protein YgcG
MIQSERTSSPLFIDGELNEWTGSLTPVKNNPIRMGVRHDDQFVYVSFQTIDETLLSQIMMGGLTVWFNSEGDKTREMGIRYPLGRTSIAPIRVDPQNPQSTPDRQNRLLSELEIVDSIGKAMRRPVDGIPGISAKAYLEFGSFSYELQIPIHTSEAMNIAIDPGSDGVFGLGFETGAIDVSQIPGARQGTGGAAVSGGRSGGRGGRGGRSGGRGGRGGGSAGARGSGGFGGLDPVEFWSQVSLIAIFE